MVQVKRPNAGTDKIGFAARSICEAGCWTIPLSCKCGSKKGRRLAAAYLLEGDAPVAITRHGDTVGCFIPARRKRSVTERAALKQAAAQLDALLAAKDITEDELVAEFKSRRAAKHR
jgi:PHD/YefM family antitoxin component YafN of YafNO toxin-antitoxin module